MGNVIAHPKADDPEAHWPGVADVSRDGVRIAFDMLREFEGDEKDDDVSVADLASLENWPRQGRPFRNVVAQHLARARQAGPEAEAGFCAVLTDILSQWVEGWSADSERYENLYNLDEVANG